jgi:hypothetical protein
MKPHGLILAAAICFLLLHFGSSRTLPGKSAATHLSGASTSSPEAFELDGCIITAVGVYFWRDWMPIVEHPGQDHGSPLYAKIKLRMENSSGQAKKLSFKGVIIDEQGQPYPATFKVQPNFSLLPKAEHDSYPNLDEQGKKAVIAKYHVLWEGDLKPAEVQAVEVLSHDGPYLPVGSRVCVEFTFTGQQGRFAIVRTPSDVISRTD